MNLRQRGHIYFYAVCAFIPSFYTRIGEVSADTKSYLYLNPTKLLRESINIWNPNIGAGTVTHQMLGYLWPMGPYYFVMDLLRIPDWVAQRCWWGLLIFMAALGARLVARTLGASLVASMLAGLAYGFSPYFLQYFSRLSGLLLPWAGLPFLIWCVVRARTDSSWRWPALFALITGTVGTVNATALIMSGLGVVVWMIADALSRVTTWRDTLRFGWRSGVLCLGVSVWWINGLLIQGKFGLPILRYTETYETVAKASSVQEIVRGLGYWFFYGGDKLGRWVGPSASYLTNPLVLVIGWSVAGLGLLCIMTINHRHRVHLALLLLFGLAVAVGAAPIGGPSVYGHFFARLVHNESGFALRSTPRAAPMVILALALGIAFGYDQLRIACAHRFPRSFVIAPYAVAILCLVNFFPWFTASAMTPSIARSEQLPAYWTQLSDTINSQSLTSSPNDVDRAYEFPGADFANYTWGGTIDPITPGLIDSGYIARELVPYGSDSTADLLNSFESRLQDGWYEPQSLKQFANLISASHVIQRNDIEHERYRTPRPEALAPVIETTPPGDLLFRGPQQNNVSSVPLIDSQTYAHARAQSYPSVEAWSIANSRPLLDAQPADSTVVLSGDGEGLIDALNANLIEPRRPIIYADTIHQRELSDISRTSSIQILTDTNRRAARRWYSVGSNTGKTDGAKTEALRKDPSDNRLMPFIADHDLDVSPDSQTVTELVGDIASVRATNYGNPVTFTPEDRPENAVDGDPRTAWRTAVFQSSRNEALEISLRRKVTTDHITLVLPTTGVTARKITKFSITLDGSASPILSSFSKGNSVTVPFASQSFSQVLIRVLSDSYGARTSFSAAPGVGIAEVKIDGVSSAEFFRLPVARVSDAPSTFLLTRRRIDQATPNRFDPESNISRMFSTTAPTAFSISGDVRISGLAKDAVINRLIGADPLVFASRRTQGSPSSFGLSAVDGDRDTSWTTPIDASIGAQLHVALGNATTRQLRFAFINDDEHSTPTAITITGTGGSSQVQVPKPDNTGTSVVDLPASIQAPITSIVIDEIAAKTSPDYFSGFPRVLPVSVREVDAGADNALVARNLSVLCHSNLLWIDDVAVGVFIKGSVTDALNRQSLDLSLCDDSVDLSAGEHTLRTALGQDVGFDLDRIVLQPKNQIVKASAPVAQTSILSRSTTHLEAEVTATGPTIVSFAYSINPGWKATYRQTSTSPSTDLGEPFVVQGYANGWLVNGSGILTLDWTPQRSVPKAIALSLAIAIMCALLLLRRPLTLQQGRRESRSLLLGRWPVALVILVLAGPLAALASIMTTFISRRAAYLSFMTLGFAPVAWIIASQIRYRYPATLDWPGHFMHWNMVAWAAIAIVITSAIERSDPTTLKT